MYRPDPPGYVVGAGLGGRTDWYRNLQANPAVTVQVGRRSFAAHAMRVIDPNERRKMRAAMMPVWNTYGPPRPLRNLLRLLAGFDYDREIREARANAADMPFIVLEHGRSEHRG
jgi:deazaflavin-dependent oxidoreductase (nitroreductase family)